MTVNLKDSSELENSTVHYLPCKIHYNGEAEVDRYFVSNRESDDEVITGSFRGYPLIGKEIQLPDGYKGRVFKEGRRPNSENVPRHLQATHSFNSLVYWNWDRTPSKVDPFISTLDWLHIAKAVHEDDEED